MDRPVENGGLLGQVISGKTRAVLVCGPAGAGKSRLCLDLYDHFHAQGSGGCIFLAPNAASTAAVRRALPARQGCGVVVSPGVMTFAALAARVLAACGDTATALSGPQRLALLREIIDDLAATRKLAALGSVADTPGLATAVDRSIAELKRAAIEPDSLAAALTTPAGKHRDLLTIYRHYQDRLHATDTYDLEGQMWQTLERLVACTPDQPLPGLEDVAAVLVDSFTDFTPTQLKILVRISRAGGRVVITLPVADDGRERMWHWTQRTRGRIHKAFGDDLEEIILPPRATGVLAAARDALFDIDPPTAPPPKHVAIVATAGTDAEVSAAAGEIKRLLLAGAPAGSIAVLVRSLDAYRPTIDRVFSEYDIPVAPASIPLTDEPVVRFLLDAADLLPAAEYSAVLRVLKSSYFRPSALGNFDRDVVAAAEMVIREGNVLEGPEAYVRAARRLAQRPGANDRDDEEQTVALGPLAVRPEQILRAAELFERLLDPDTGPAENGGKVDPERLAAMIDMLQLRQAAVELESPELAARDLRAIARLEQVLTDLSGHRASMRRLRELLAAASAPAARTESLVDVLDVLDARGLRFDHVFLLGTAEGQFPPRASENALISESDRRAWAARGAALDSRDDLTAREMLLFYLAVTRAEKTLTLSYQHTTSSGGAGAAGAFLTSLLETFPEETRDAIETHLPPGRFVPDESRLASARDTFNAALAGLFNPPGIAPSALAWTAAHHRPRLNRAARGIWARHRRWQAGACNEFDGRLTQPDLTAHLAQTFGPAHAFSAKALNTYAQCPWRFFAEYVLALAPLTPPQRRLEPVHEGLFCHRVLFRVLSTLAGPNRTVHLGQASPDAISDALEDAVAQEAAQTRSAMVPYPALWAIQQQRIQRDVSQYLKAASANDPLAAESFCFELAFGLEDEDHLALADPASCAAPVEIDTPGGTVLVRGRIDRVDRISFEGQTGLLAVDYKTGSIPKLDAIRGGRNLQLPLYAAALEKLFDQPCLGGAFHRIGAKDARYDHFFAEVSRRGEKYSPFPDYAAALQEALAKIDQYVQGIRAGHFDLMPVHECTYCDYRRICQFSEARMDLKTAPGHTEDDA